MAGYDNLAFIGKERRLAFGWFHKHITHQRE